MLGRGFRGGVRVVWVREGEEFVFLGVFLCSLIWNGGFFLEKVV